jgi:AcrR family transcriptional regulator
MLAVMSRSPRRTTERRTQQQRREATIKKILTAAADALIEVGYAGASISAICERAGVTSGGLFRHFKSHDEVMAAVGADVGARILAGFRRDFEATIDSTASESDRLARAIGLVRAHCRSRLNRAWFELATAARSNATLRRALRPTAVVYFAAIEDLARDLLPSLATDLGPMFPVIIHTVVAMFDGELVHHAVVAQPGIEAARLELVVAAARLLLAANVRAGSSRS